VAKPYKKGKNWYLRFRNGKVRHRVSLGPDYAAAVIKAPKVEAEYRGNLTKRIQGDYSWFSFKKKYLEWKAITHKEQTIYRDRLAFKYLETYFPIQRLESIRPANLELFQTKLKKDRKSNVNTNRLVRSIKRAMRKAEEWELVPPQNWRAVKMLKEPKGKLHWFSEEERQTLFKKLPGVWKIIARLGIRAGLRRGEIHTLQWSSVDFAQNMIRVEGNNGWQPKDHEARGIPMTKDLATHLKSLPYRTGFVLGADRPSLDVMTSYFKKLIKKAELEGNIHKCRHTFGSHLAQKGASPRQIQELMGHSSLKTTEIYMHLSPGNLRSAISLLDGHPSTHQLATTDFQ